MRMDNELVPGRLYLAEEKKANAPFDLYRQCQECSRPSLLITRCHPDMLREEHGIWGDNVLWLSMSSGERNLDPTGLSRLSEIMARHMRENRNGVVLFDGLEYLVSMNEFKKVLSILDRMYEEAAINKGIFLATLDPMAFGEQERAFLERNAVCFLDGERPILP